jgi:ERCC4-type nuclease
MQIDDIKELEKIKGIGPKTTDKINQFFTVERNCSE